MSYYPTHYGPAYHGLSNFSIIFGIFMFLLLLVFIFGIVTYVFSSIGFYSMAKKRNIPHPWFAWIPIARLYLQGELINDDVSIGNWHIPYAKILLPLLPVGLVFIAFPLGFIPYLGTGVFALLSLALSFYNCVALFWLFSIYSLEHRIVFLVLSIIFPFLGPIFIFAIRHKDSFDSRHPEGFVEDNYDSKSVFSLSLGIASFFTFFFTTGIVGIIMSITAMKEKKATGKPHGMALAGLICSIASIAFKFILGAMIIGFLILALAVPASIF